ncbi:MAG: hypothetical protein AB7E37_01670 [Candidatus Altimarinota bacterium]
MKKIIFILLGYFSVYQTYALDLQRDMLPNNNTVGVDAEGTGVLNQIFIYVKNFMFAVLGLIAIGVFLYFGFKLISARGNEEEFKKALMGFVYAIIGLAIIPLAWGVVRLIVSLDF